MPDAELIVVPLRNSRAGLPGERVVIPSSTPVVPRIVVGIGLVVTGVEHAVAVDVPVVVVIVLPEGAGLSLSRYSPCAPLCAAQADDFKE
jgi:hypothetical protein